MLHFVHTIAKQPPGANQLPNRPEDNIPRIIKNNRKTRE